MGGVGTKSGSNNIGIGTTSLDALTSGYWNVGVGMTSLRDVSAGFQNVGVGYQAGYSISTGAYNTLVGSKAGGPSATNIVDGNVCIGYDSGHNLSLISNQLWIANSATLTPLIYGVFPNTSLTFTASDVILTGALTVPVYTPGTTTDKLYNIGHALYFNGAAVSTGGGGGATDIDGLSDGSTSGGTEDVFLGTNSGPLGDYNTGVGYGALDVVAATGTYNSAFGNYALGGITTGDNNVGIGSNAGLTITEGSNNIAIGKDSLSNAAATTNSGFYHNISIGVDSMGGLGLKDGKYNVGIGTSVLNGLTDGDYNVGIGYQSGSILTNASNNISIGRETLGAGSAIYGFSYNIAIGHQVMGGSGAKTKGYNVGIGYRALYALTGGYNNVAIGDSSLISITSGLYNTSIGSDTGKALTSGDYNTFLGYNSGKDRKSVV